MPKDAVLVERNSPGRGEIGGNARARCDHVVHGDDPRVFRLEPGHGARKGVAQTGHDLKQREIGVGQASADQMPIPGLVAF
jgi:hypothetical protein